MNSIATAPVAVSLPGFQNISQIAVITRDGERTMKALSAALGAGGFKQATLRPPELFHRTYDGETGAWTMRLGITWIGDMQLEVIEPLEGRSVFDDYLRERGDRQGVQHIFLARGALDYDAAVARFESAGYPFVQQAQINAPGRLGWLPMPALPGFLAASLGAKFGYTCSRNRLKLDVELARFPPGVSHRLALRAAIAEAWVPEDQQQHFETQSDEAILRTIDGVYVLGHDLQALLAGYSKLTDRSPEVSAYNDSELPGRGRLAAIELKSTTLFLVHPESGPVADWLAFRGEGLEIVRGRPRVASPTETRSALESRGWRVHSDSLPRAREGLFATHDDVPFALWVVE